MSGHATSRKATGRQRPVALAAGLMFFALLIAGLAGGAPPEAVKAYTVVCGLRG